MIRNLIIYVDLAIKDVFRLWAATQLQVIIVAGICLPILLLIGLKNGHIKELRKELVTSPVGRQIIFWSAQSGDLLTDEVLGELNRNVPNVELIIPESQRLVFLLPNSSNADDNGISDVEPIPLTVYSTLTGDPILAQFAADKISSIPTEIILAQTVAEKISAHIGDEVNIKLVRRRSDVEESHVVSLRVAGILPGSSEQGNIGYASVSLMKMFESYGAGSSVPGLGIQAMESLRATDRYDSMLLFCFRGEGTELNDADFIFLGERGLAVEQVDDERIVTLFGMLKPNAVDDLKVYKLHRIDDDEDSFTPIVDTPQLLARNTQAEDDFLIRWNEPLTLQIADRQVTLVGLTLPTERQTGGWIQKFLRDDSRWFTYEETVDAPLSFRVPTSQVSFNDELLELNIAENVRITLALQGADSTVVTSDAETNVDSDEVPFIEETQPTKSTGSEIAESDPNPFIVVPVNLLAYLHQYKNGLVEYDQLGKNFVELDTKTAFTKARLYTKTIDDVPRAVAELSARKFAVLSESSRIAEIQQQDGSLRVLVGVVAIGVFFFGVITVFSVLVDSTDRKKGTIGILRVMGLPSRGVLFVVLFRSLVIGVLAAILCSSVGFLLQQILRADFTSLESLSWKTAINVSIEGVDYLLVASGAILCASLGSVLPAIRASSLDPFDAIMEGQFN